MKALGQIFLGLALPVLALAVLLSFVNCGGDEKDLGPVIVVIEPVECGDELCCEEGYKLQDHKIHGLRCVEIDDVEDGSSE